MEDGEDPVSEPEFDEDQLIGSSGSEFSDESNDEGDAEDKGDGKTTGGDQSESDGESGSGGESEGSEVGEHSDDSLGGTLDKCPVCLRVLNRQEIGVPDCCDHAFCLACILEWAATASTCPIDRKSFNTVLIKNEVNGNILRIQEIQGRNSALNEDWDDFSDPTYCEVCGNCDREHRLLLCDGCDLGYHLECLEPPLEYVPLEDWYCSSCETSRSSQTSEPVPGTSAATRRSSAPRVPRTGLSRRIMNRRRRGSPPACQSAKVQKNVTPTNRSNRTRKKTTRRKSRRSKQGTPRKAQVKKRRRGKKNNPNRRRVALQRKPATSRGRLVQQLGILPPRPGQVYVGLPQYRPSYSGSNLQASASAAIRNQRYQAGIAPLRLYGNDDLADCLSSDDEGGSVGLARPSTAHRSIGQPLKRSLPYGTREIGPSQVSSSANVLGPILSAQYILHKDKNIHIQRDGTLVPSISVSFDKFGKEINDNDSSGYDSFGNSPNRAGLAGRGMSILTATGGSSTNTNATGHISSSGAGSGSAPVTESSASDSTVSTTTESGGPTGTSSASSLGTSAVFLENNSNSRDSQSYENYLYRIDGESGSSSPTKSDSKKSDPKPGDEEDDDFNIYSDIEEEPVQEKDTYREDELILPESSNADAERDSDSDMVIDEHFAGAIGPRERESRSSAESLSIVLGPTLPHSVLPLNLQGQEPNSPDGSPALPEVDPDSPLSIPLPDSTPPPSVHEFPLADDEDEISLDNNLSENEPNKVLGYEEYDPSYPLTSSEEEEPESEKADGEPPKTPSQSPEKLVLTPQKVNTSTSSIPLPSEDYRRPTIQFSIPTRHRIFSMGSLIKRNKGVLKKEAKSGSSISFQSEMSKAFGTEKEEGEDDGFGQGDEDKVSLVAEIFGSDEDEESPRSLSAHLLLHTAVQDTPPQIALPPLPTLPLSTIAVPEPSGLEAGKWKKIVKDTEPVRPLFVPSDSPPEDDDVVLIGEGPPEVQIIETPPTEPEDEPRPLLERRRDVRGRHVPLEVEEDRANQIFESELVSTEDTLSQHSKRKSEDLGKENSIMAEKPKSSTSFDIMEYDSEKPPAKDKAPKKDKESKKKTRKRKKSLSNESNCEEGEILDVVDKKRKKVKKSKKSKKGKRSKDSRSASPVEFAEKKVPEGSRGLGTSTSSDENEDDPKRVSWKKPSKSTKERNYRDGKPKPEEKYFREREKKRDESPARVEKSKIKDKSPKPKSKDIGKDRKSKHENSVGKRGKKLSRSKSKSRSNTRSLSKSRGRSRRGRSVFSGSSSPTSFKSRSRSRLSRSPRSVRARHHRRRSLSSRRPLRSRTRSRSRSLRRLNRSRSPVGRRINRRSRSLSRGRRGSWRRWSGSSSRSRSVSPKGRKKKEKVPAPDEKAKKSKKEPKEKAVVEKGPPASTEPVKDKPSDKDKKKKRKKREKSISPAKAIFADGDSIVVSLNFQSKTKEPSGTGTNGKEAAGQPGPEGSDKKKKGSKGGSKGSGKSKPLKKTILIDLETSPIQEQNIGVSPTLIVLSDDDEHHDYTSGSSKSKANSIDRDGVTVSTTSSGNGHESNKSPIYRDSHGVQADSTQLSLLPPHQSESGKTVESVSVFSRLASSSPDDLGSGTSTRGDSLVTSTRDSLEGTAALHDDYTLSPCTPPKETESSPIGTTPPLPPGSPPKIDSMGGGPSIPVISLVPNSGLNRPHGIGNIPGLFVSSSMMSATNGGYIAPPPVVIPTPPAPQLRLSQPIFNQSVLQTVANALYGPLMGPSHRPLPVRPNLANDGSAQNLSGGRMGSNVITKKFGAAGGGMGGTSGLGSKEQNSHANPQGLGRGAAGGSSPMSPNSSDGDDLFEPPMDGQHEAMAPSSTVKGVSSSKLDKASTAAGSGDGASRGKRKTKNSLFESVFGGPIKKPSSAHQKKPDKMEGKGKAGRHHKSRNSGQKKEIPKLSEEELRLTGEVPTSAVELRVKEKFLKKLNRQERVVDEVKTTLKPHYIKKHITKDEYKEILRKAVPKICHNKTGEINPLKIKELIEAYVKKFWQARKK